MPNGMALVPPLRTGALSRLRVPQPAMSMRLVPVCVHPDQSGALPATSPFPTGGPLLLAGQGSVQSLDGRPAGGCESRPESRHLVLELSVAHALNSAQHV